MTFKNYLLGRAKKTESRIILALDSIISGKTEQERENSYKITMSRAMEIIQSIEDYLAGIKFNRHLVLPFGLFNPLFTDIVSYIKKNNIPLIMDAKINDIGATNYVIAQYYFEAGFDALICNPIIGWKDGLEQIHAQTIGHQNRGLIFLTYLSHADASFGYGRLVRANNDSDPERKTTRESLVPLYEVLAQFGMEKQADGLIVGATHPHVIKRIRNLLNNSTKNQQPLIISPGVGAQGGSAYDAILSGADFLIVGRKIMRATSPVGEVQRLQVDIADALEERGLL